MDDAESLRALHAAVDAGMNFVDTADVYGDGRSERLWRGCGASGRRDRIRVATKAGRRLPKQTVRRIQPREPRRPGSSEASATSRWRPSTCSSSTARPPGSTTARGVRLPRRLRGRGEGALLRGERRDGRRGLAGAPPSGRADRADHLQHVPPEAGGGLLPRGPGGRRGHPGPGAPGERSPHRQAAGRLGLRCDDHRRFNREGQAFDKGETFSGVPYDVGLRGRRAPAPPRARRERPWPRSPCASSSMYEAVSCAIPGAKTPEQASRTPAAADCRPSTRTPWQQVRAVYDELIRPHVHASW